MQANDIGVWLGLDVGKESHHACALDRNGDKVHDKPLGQDETEIRDLLSRLSERGRVLLVVDQPNTIGSLPLAVARDMGVAVAYLPGGAMRKAAQLLPGDAKTDERDAYVIAFTALHMPSTLRDCGSDDETLAGLKVLSGYDEDLAWETTRHVNRLRSLLFKLCVEINMMGHTVAAHFRADPINRRELRAYAVDEVLRTNGQISFDDALDLQRQIDSDE